MDDFSHNEKRTLKSEYPAGVSNNTIMTKRFYVLSWGIKVISTEIVISTSRGRQITSRIVH